MDAIAVALKKLKEAAGMTDTEVWAAAGISPGALSRYLGGSRGRMGINGSGAETIEKLAAVFDLPPTYFVEYRMWQVRQAAKLYPDLTSEVYDVLMAFVAREPGGLSSLKSKG